MVQIVWSGDTKKFQRFLKREAFRKILGEEIMKATARNAAIYQAQIVKNIRGFQRSKKRNAAMTIALKQSQIPLVDTGSMWRAIEVELKSQFEAHVGFLENQTTSHSARSQTARIKTVVPLLERGFTVKLTPKMRKWLFVQLRKAGVEKDPNQRSASSGSGVMRIPPRPFITNVFESDRMQKKAQKNWNIAVRTAYKRMGAL